VRKSSPAIISLLAKVWRLQCQVWSLRGKRPVFPSGIVLRLGLTMCSWFRLRDYRQNDAFGGGVL